MTDYVDLLEAELVRVARERTRRQRVRVAPSAGAVITFVASAAAVAVAAVALIVGAHAHHGDDHPAASIFGLPALENELAVLRRPQTAVDRAIGRTAITNAPPSRQQIPSLTRFITRIKDIAIYLVVNAPGSDAQDPNLGPQAAIVTVTGHGASESPGFTAGEIRRGTGRFLPVPLAGAGDGPLAGGVQLVPDEVATVQVLFDRNGGVFYGKPTANVVVVFPINRYGDVTRIEWLDAHGTVVSSATPPQTEKLSELLAEAPATLIGQYEQSPHPAAPELLADFPTLAHGAYRSASVTVSAPALQALPGPLIALAASAAAHHGPDLAATRHVTSTSGVDVWFIPALHTACVAEATADSGTGACARNLGALERDGLWTYDRPRHAGLFIVGIVPRGNTSVTVTLRGGGSRIVPVLDGVVVTPARDVATIRLRSASGQPETVEAGPEIGPAVVSLY